MVKANRKLFQAFLIAQMRNQAKSSGRCRHSVLEVSMWLRHATE